jgi:hypothetical protein
MQYYRLKELLDNLYISYKYKYSSKDPVWILHRFNDENDIELLFNNSRYAYGLKHQINRFIELFLQESALSPTNLL